MRDIEPLYIWGTSIWGRKGRGEYTKTVQGRWSGEAGGCYLGATGGGD